MRFELKLTDEQAAIIDHIWREHGRLRGAMMLQPKLAGGSYGILRGRVFSPDEAEEIEIVLEKLQKAATP